MTCHPGHDRNNQPASTCPGTPLPDSNPEFIPAVLKISTWPEAGPGSAGPVARQPPAPQAALFPGALPGKQPHGSSGTASSACRRHRIIRLHHPECLFWFFRGSRITAVAFTPDPAAPENLPEIPYFSSDITAINPVTAVLRLGILNTGTGQSHEL